MRWLLLLLLFVHVIPAQAGDYSFPLATIRSYLEATKKNDLEEAKKCWCIDDNNACGALDVVIGMWISSRKLSSATEAKFGADGLKLLGKWHRSNCTNQAIAITLERSVNISMKDGGTAHARFKWEEGDDETTPVFLCIKAPLVLRKVDGQWKLDANQFTGSDKATDLFAEGKIWPIWREEMKVMDDLTTLLEKGRIKDLAAFEAELKSRVSQLKAKFERKE